MEPCTAPLVLAQLQLSNKTQATGDGETMFRFKISAFYAFILCTLLTSGCAQQTPKPDTNELQLSAMKRWQACIERHTADDRPTTKQVNRLLSQTCEGHMRDIIALYPPHLAKQMNQMLITRGYRYVGRSKTPNQKQSKKATAVNSALP